MTPTASPPDKRFTVQLFRERLEQEPVRFMETEGLAALVGAVAEVARFVGADARDVVPVGNSTTAVNAVLRSLSLGRGDLILMANTTYPAVSVLLSAQGVLRGARALPSQGCCGSTPR